jgi:hypothetical protein
MTKLLGLAIIHNSLKQNIRLLAGNADKRMKKKNFVRLRENVIGLFAKLFD